MPPPHAVRDAAAEAARRRRVRSTGFVAPATVLAVRRLGVLDGGVSLVELDLSVSMMVDGVVSVATVTTTEPVSLMLAARARPGAIVDVIISGAEDGVVIEWSG